MSVKQLRSKVAISQSYVKLTFLLIRRYWLKNKLLQSISVSDFFVSDTGLSSA